MKVGEKVKHRGYDITRQNKTDYVVEVAHDSLKEAKEWIDRLIEDDELVEGKK